MHSACPRRPSPASAAPDTELGRHPRRVRRRKPGRAVPRSLSHGTAILASESDVASGASANAAIPWAFRRLPFGGGGMDAKFAVRCLGLALGLGCGPVRAPKRAAVPISLDTGTFALPDRPQLAGISRAGLFETTTSTVAAPSSLPLLAVAWPGSRCPAAAIPRHGARARPCHLPAAALRASGVGQISLQQIPRGFQQPCIVSAQGHACERALDGLQDVARFGHHSGGRRADNACIDSLEPNERDSGRDQQRSAVLVRAENRRVVGSARRHLMRT